MELQYYGANCISLTIKGARVVIDDNLSQLGLKQLTKAEDISLSTSSKLTPVIESRFSADSPGEYELAGVVINGIAARAHMDEEGQATSVIYTIEAEDLKVAILGHIHPDLTDDQLEQIGMVDIAVLPIGNSGYTLDGVGALQVVKKIEPKIVIPTHYADKAIKYEVPQAELSESLKAMSMEPAQTLAKFKPKPTDLTDSTQLIVLERQSV